jgi:hypothetical protein
MLHVDQETEPKRAGSVEPDRGGSMTTVRVPGFTPLTSGFRFRNAFAPAPIRELRLQGIATLTIGDAANGLCGGMSFSAADLHRASIAPPSDTSPPVSGSPAFDYIVDRQIASFAGGSVPLRFYRLMDPSRPDREPFWAPWLGWAGVDRHSRTYVMVHQEWPRIRSDLDQGRLSMIGLVRAIDRDPRKLSSNHQVVVYGYDLEGSQVTLRVYDPNWPGEEVTLGFDAGDPNGSIRPTYSTTDAPLVCFFRAPYEPQDPTAWRQA